MPSSRKSRYLSCLSDSDKAYLERWFAPETLAELECIKSAISDLPTKPTQNFYNVCLSNILRDVSWQKKEDLRSRREVTNLATGETVTRFLDEATRSTKTVVGFLAEQGPVDARGHVVRQADARRATAMLPKLIGKVDAVITSPPYATALPYIDTDRLNLIYFGLLSRDSHRALDTRMIGNREVTKRLREEYWGYYEANKALLPRQTRYLINQIDQLNKTESVGFRRQNLSALLSKYCLLYTSPSPRDS